MNKLIDHTLLKANVKKEQIYLLCEEAKKYEFASVCVNPSNVFYAAQLLDKSKVKVCTVIGFPLGSNTIDTKYFETKQAIQLGAQEIDMVINIGEALNHNWQYILDEIKKVRMSCEGYILKVILETCYFNDNEIIKLCQLAHEANADYVKTSTGFGTDGANEHVVSLMLKSSNGLKVKASGGIKSKLDAQKMILAGASRIGTSNGIKIVKGDIDGDSTY